MSAPVTLALGPLCLRVSGVPCDPLLAPFETAVRPGCSPIEVAFEHATPGGNDRAKWRSEGKIAGPGFTASLGPDRWTVRADLDTGGDRITHVVLSAIVTYLAVRSGLIVLHAGGVLIDGGVAALLAPSGTGKSTAVRGSPARAFAYNGILLDPVDRTVWPLPFTGHDDPPVESAAPYRLVLWVALDRGELPRHEWLPSREARTTVVKRCVFLDGDPGAAWGAFAALEIATALPMLRIERPFACDTAVYVESCLKRGRVHV